MSETRYTETEYLVAVMNGDRNRAAAILAGMLPGEHRRFVDTLETALDWAEEEYVSMGRHGVGTVGTDG